MTTTTTTVWKRTCNHGEAKWPKCPCPWYLKQFKWGGKVYDPNLSRYARVVLDEELTTKTRAEAVGELVRTAIREGTYTSAKQQKNAQPEPSSAPGQTISALIKAFDKATIAADVEKRDTTKDGDRGCLARFAAFIPPKRKQPLGDWPIEQLSIDDVIAFRTSAPMRALQGSSWNKYRDLIVGLLRFAKAEGACARDVFADADEKRQSLLGRGKSNRRTQRVSEDLEARLLAAAGRAFGELTATRLQAIIVAAIETGMRRGELLALLWRDVNWDGGYIIVRAEEVGASKTGTQRKVPLSERLRDELLALRTDPTGAQFGAASYVFGNAIGEKLTTIRKAWHTAVLRAHGHAVEWTKTGGLSPACSAQLDRIDLHFHDLRHEAGCRWLESKHFNLEEIRQMYGHTTVAQTAHYLHAEASSALSAMQRYDAARRRQRDEAQRATGTTNQTETGLATSKTTAKRQQRQNASAGPRLVKGRKC